MTVFSGRRRRGAQGNVSVPPAPYRDYLVQPYTSPTETTTGSIWNTPLGDAADERPAGLPVAYNAAGKVTIDEIWLCMDPAAPVKPISNGTTLNHNTMPALSASAVIGYPSVASPQVRIAASDIHDSSWNGIFGGLKHDDQTKAWTGQALNRNVAADNPQIYRTGSNYPTGIRGLDDLRGDGRKGAHGGGQCGGIGGAITRAEYDAAVAGNPQAINHRLCLNVDSKICLSQANQGFGTGLSGPGWRWPAYRADAEAFDPSGEGFYGRTGTGFDGMVMGSLLGLPLGYNISGITDPLVHSIAWAALNFGFQIVDSTGGINNPRYAISCAWDRETAWMARNVVTFHQALMGVITSLVLIHDCTPTTPGGAGNPRAPYPLPLAPL